jgi:hypothetical protein
MGRRDLRAGDLRQCVDSGVGTAGAVDGYRSAIEPRERFFQQPLHGHASGLALPSDEVRSVVCQRQLDGSHTVREPGFTTGWPARHNGHASG